jgi:hypothetical protein
MDIDRPTEDKDHEVEDGIADVGNPPRKRRSLSHPLVIRSPMQQ